MPGWRTDDYVLSTISQSFASPSRSGHGCPPPLWEELECSGFKPYTLRSESFHLNQALWPSVTLDKLLNLSLPQFTGL